jgi:hypothetical protein
MRFCFPLIILFSIIFTGCKKSDTDNISTPRNLPIDRGCIERVWMPVTAHSINASDISTVNNLFNSNNIDHSELRYYRYTHDSLHTLYPPYTVYDQKSVRTDQYLNGVRIFTGDLVFNFYDDQFKYMGGHLTNGTSLDTLPFLNTGQLRKLFLDDIERFDHASNRFRDSCFKAEFGYYNLNSGISYTPEVLVKAWKVTTRNSVFPSEYPIAYYQDTDGKRIYYDNGMRTFK